MMDNYLNDDMVYLGINIWLRYIFFSKVVSLWWNLQNMIQN